MLSSIERHSCSSAAYSIDKSTGCCYQWHGSSTVDKIFWSRYLWWIFLQKYFNIFSSLLFSSNCLQVHVVFSQYWATSQKEGVSKLKGNIHWPQKFKSEVLPLQYQDNGESILQIRKKRYGLSYLVQHVLFPPLAYSFVTNNLEL